MIPDKNGGAPDARCTCALPSAERLKLGADAYIIMNPLDVGELLTAVERALARRGIRGKDLSRYLGCPLRALFPHEPLFLPEHRVASQILPLVKAHTPSAADLHTVVCGRFTSSPIPRFINEAIADS